MHFLSQSEENEIRRKVWRDNVFEMNPHFFVNSAVSRKWLPEKIKIPERSSFEACKTHTQANATLFSSTSGAENVLVSVFHSILTQKTQEYEAKKHGT